jgi:hypothetical protein
MSGPAVRGMLEQRFGEEGACTARGIRQAHPGEVASRGRREVIRM